jgi:hypothetical protein
MRTRIGASTADETAGRKRHDGGLDSRPAKVRRCTSQYSLATPIVVLYLFDSQAFHLHGPQPLDSSFYRSNDLIRGGFEPLELLTKYGWYVNNDESRSWPVGVKLPNALGMFDMHGNVREWCHNLYRFPARHTDAVKTNEFRSLRGGCFTAHSTHVRSASHGNVKPPNRDYRYGFRPSRTYNLSP